MKHQIIYASLFTAAIGFTACEAEKFDKIDNQPAEITVIAKAADNETSRTIFEEGKEGYSVKWDANNEETLKLLFVKVNANGSYSNNGHYTPGTVNKKVIVTPDDDSSTGTFSFTPQGGEGGKDDNLVWVIYPYEGVANDIIPFYSPDKNVYIDIPTEQAGRPNMPAAAASLMFGQFNYPEGYNGAHLTCRFEHLAAYGKIKFTNFPKDKDIAGKVQSIVLSVEDENANLTGARYIYNVEQKTISAGTFKLPNNGTSETEPKSYVKVSYGDDYKSGDAIMFAVAPSGTDGYKSLKLTVTFPRGTYEKTLDASKHPVTFKKGLVSVLNISLEDAQPVVATE